jgi:drug/metabolite transporter (DMT)-like permease
LKNAFSSNKRVLKHLDTEARCTLKNALFVVLIVLGNTFGNLLLAISMARMPSFSSVPFPQFLQLVLSNGFFLGGTFLSALSLLAQLTMYTWADLSYVLPVTASGYVVTAILGRFFLQEHVSVFRWIGVVIISLGVFFVAETPPDTKHLETAPAEAEQLEGAEN